MNPQYDEHLRDSAPDASRFDGFDRGDADQPEDHDSFDAEAYLAEPPAPKPSLAKRMLISLGLFTSQSLVKMPELLMPTAVVPVHTADKARRNQRKLCRELGRRQYRRATRRSYAMKADATLLDLT